MKKLILLFLVLSNFIGCDQQMDKNKLYEIEHTYLGASLSEAETTTRFEHLYDEYGNYNHLYHELLEDQELLERRFESSAFRADLGSYFLNATIEDKRPIATKLAKKLIDMDVDPFEADCFEITPAFYAVHLKNKEIFDYIVQKDKIAKRQKVDEDLRAYARYYRLM